MSLERRRFWAGLLLASAGFSSPSPAAGARLTLLATGGCVTAEELEEALGELVEGPLALDGVVVEVAPVGSAWRAHLRTREGQRTLTGESCRAVAQAVAVVLALAHERRAPAPVLPAPSEATPVVAPAAPPLARTDAPRPVAVPSDAPPSRQGAAEPAPGVVLALRAGVLAELGMLPAPSLGPRLALALRFGPWSAELIGAALLARRAELGGAGSPAGDIYWFAGQAAGCRSWSSGVGVCVGAEAGQLVGTGTGVQAPYTGRGAWLAISPSALLRASLGDSPAAFAWEAGVSGAVGLVRPEFGFEELGVLHRPSPLSGRSWVGFAWR